ncbi:MAG: hypothetical protein ACRDRX_00515 [Pseudonocardiaceae bacterium]
MPAPDQFVNPYTFVSFPEELAARSAPHGHGGDAQLWSGTIGITIKARTPVLVRGTCGADETTLPHRPGPGGTPQQIIPGSSLHGAVRALHETLTGSCLRVFDQNFSPVYRDIAADTHLLRLALVTEVDDDGRPICFQLCSRPSDPRKAQKERIHHGILSTLGGPDRLVSGARLGLTMGDKGVTAAWEDPGGEWVVFISDSGARSGSYHAAVRRLCADPSPTLGDAAWQDFLAAVQHTDDLRSAQEADTHLAPVTWPHEGGITVGQRYRASTRLRVGQPVWLRLNGRGSDVVQLQLAQIWRHRGTTARDPGARAAGENAIKDRSGHRVPAGALACTEATKLCPSCRLLGAADTREEDKRKDEKEGRPVRRRPADQQSYRGHVRFSDAVRSDKTTSLRVVLPPLGAPHPGAGQFYLERRDTAEGDGGRPPLREWGSAADQPEPPRPLRGRKFYWHTSGVEGVSPLRGKARPHHLTDHLALTTRAAAFPHHTEFVATITVVDVDLEQLGSLLAALQPAAVLDRDNLVVHLGGGRSLGYGSCEISIDQNRTWLWRSATRYGASADPTDADEIRRAAIAAFRAAAPAEVQRTWPALATALILDHVPPDRVWYPPGAPWSARKTDEGKQEFDEGYAFWQQTSGLFLSGGKQGKPRKGYPFRVLPDIQDDQHMEIVCEAVDVELDKEL